MFENRIDDLRRIFTCANCLNDDNNVKEFPCSECTFGNHDRSKKVYFIHKDCRELLKS